MERWKTETEKIELIYQRTQNSAILLELLKAQYGYLGYLTGETNRSNETKEWIDRFENYINDLFALKTHKALAYSYLASFYAYKIVAYPATAIVNGRRCMNAIEKSISLAPDTYIVWSNRAIIETNLPAIAGADYHKAITYFDKAIDMIAEKETDRCNWILLNTLVWKAKCYEKLKNQSMARKTYDDILEIAPHFDSVKRWRDRLSSL